MPRPTFQIIVALEYCTRYKTTGQGSTSYSRVKRYMRIGEATKGQQGSPPKWWRSCLFNYVISVSILDITIYYDFTVSHPWRKLVKCIWDFSVLFITIAWDAINTVNIVCVCVCVLKPDRQRELPCISIVPMHQQRLQIKASADVGSRALNPGPDTSAPATICCFPGNTIIGSINQEQTQVSNQGTPTYDNTLRNLTVRPNTYCNYLQ